MRDYAKIAPTFWIGETGKLIRKLGRDSQVVAFYLLTSPQSHMFGLYYMPMPLVSHETGIPLEGASKALQSLCEVGFCSYDTATEWVFVFEMAKYQIAEQLKIDDNRVKGINKDYHGLPKNPFLKDFYDRYHMAFHIQTARDYESPRKPLERGSGKPPKEDEIPNCPIREIVKKYHEALPHFPRVRELSDTLSTTVRTRWRENKERQNLEWWEAFFIFIGESDYLSGKVNTFMASFDWIMGPKNFSKIMNGQYINRIPNGTAKENTGDKPKTAADRAAARLQELAERQRARVENGGSGSSHTENVSGMQPDAA